MSPITQGVVCEVRHGGDTEFGGPFSVLPLGASLVMGSREQAAEARIKESYMAEGVGHLDHVCGMQAQLQGSRVCHPLLLGALPWSPLYR